MLGSTEMGLIGPTDGFPSGMALGAPEGTLEGAYVGYFGIHLYCRYYLALSVPKKVT